MRKTKRNRTIKKTNKCVYTDETRRLIKIIKDLKQTHKKNSKTFKNKKK